MSKIDISSFKNFVSNIDPKTYNNSHLYSNGKSSFDEVPFKAEIFNDLIDQISIELENGSIKKAFFKIRQIGMTSALLLLCFYLLCLQDKNNIVFISHSEMSSKTNYKKLLKLIQHSNVDFLKINSSNFRISNSNNNSYVEFSGANKVTDIVYNILPGHNFNFVIMDERSDYNDSYINLIYSNSKNFILTCSAINELTFERIASEFERNCKSMKGKSQIIKPKSEEVLNYLYTELLAEADPLFCQHKNFKKDFYFSWAYLYEAYGLCKEDFPKVNEQHYLLITLNQVHRKFLSWIKEHNKLPK